MGKFRVYALSECAVTLEFGRDISLSVLQDIRQLDALLRGQPFEGFRTTVPAYATLTVYYDPVGVMRSPGLVGVNAYERVARYMWDVSHRGGGHAVTTDTTVTIPVCYGGMYGPDLDDVARQHGLDAADVIALHSTAHYHVHMIGFTPGFAYLGGLPESLATPRREIPRATVPAGSVGIGGHQTGIYPLETPGGWQLIGRTPLRLFDPGRTRPVLLRAGDRVVFRPITPEAFDTYLAGHDAYTD